MHGSTGACRHACMYACIVYIDMYIATHRDHHIRQYLHQNTHSSLSNRLQISHNLTMWELFLHNESNVSPLDHLSRLFTATNSCKSQRAKLSILTINKTCTCHLEMKRIHQWRGQFWLTRGKIKNRSVERSWTTSQIIVVR